MHALCLFFVCVTACDPGTTFDVRPVPELGTANTGYPGVAARGVSLGCTLFPGDISHVSVFYLLIFASRSVA